MCRSIESAILGFVNCFINLMIVLKNNIIYSIYC